MPATMKELGIDKLSVDDRLALLKELCGTLTGESLADDQKRQLSEMLALLSGKPAKPKRPTLAELAARITDENRHEEVDWGPPVGKEVW